MRMRRSGKQRSALLYDIANILPGFLEERGFTAEPANGVQESTSHLMDETIRSYYRDYISNHGPYEYQSLHITFYDNSSRSYMEVQLQTKAIIWTMWRRSVRPTTWVTRNARKMR